MVNALAMKRGYISAYSAAKKAGVTANTIAKWVWMKKLKGYSHQFEGHWFYEVNEEDLERIIPLISKAKNEGRKGLSLL